MSTRFCAWPCTSPALSRMPKTSTRKPFLKAFRYIGNFRFECSFYTWIYRIVTNLCLDQLRRRKTRREDHAVVVDRTGDEIDVLASISDNRSFSNPARELDRKLLGEKIQAALDQAHAARADGLRAEALPGSAAAHHRRDVEHHGRDRQEYPLPRNQEIESAIGGVEVTGNTQGTIKLEANG